MCGCCAVEVFVATTANIPARKQARSSDMMNVTSCLLLSSLSSSSSPSFSSSRKQQAAQNIQTRPALYMRSRSDATRSTQLANTSGVSLDECSAISLTHNPWRISSFCKRTYQPGEGVAVSTIYSSRHGRAKSPPRCCECRSYCCCPAPNTS